MSEPRPDVSETRRFIDSMDGTDPSTPSALVELVYEDLRRLAAACMARERSGDSVQATDLVHEAYLRLSNGGQHWNGRPHFFAAAAEAMRRILIDRARRRSAKRHGGDHRRAPLPEDVIVIEEKDTDIERLDLALEKLEKEDATKAALVKLHFLLGLTIRETADALDISRATAERYWTYSRARLYQWMTRLIEEE